MLVKTDVTVYRNDEPLTVEAWGDYCASDMEFNSWGCSLVDATPEENTTIFNQLYEAAR